MDIQDINGVTRLGSKLRQEIRHQAQGYHERKHHFWKRQAYILWIALGVMIIWKLAL